MFDYVYVIICIRLISIIPTLQRKLFYIINIFNIFLGVAKIILFAVWNIWKISNTFENNS